MSAAQDPRELELVAWLRDAIADLLDLEPEAVDPDRPLTELGLSSRDAVGLVGDLEDHLDRDLDATLVWKTPTITLLARRLVYGDDAVQEATPAAISSSAAADDDDDDGDRIAIVGLGCRLPGGADGPRALWDLLLEGADATGEVPEGRWEQFTPADPAAQALVDATQRRGGFLDDVAGFDAAFFGITPREAELMDPQQRMLLEVAHEALAHAGIAPSSLRGSATGVYVGMCANEYSHLTTADLARIDAWTSTGSALSIAANRLSYLLDLRGPSMTTDTACSSSLVAVHQAVRAIADGDIDQAVVGGVNLLLAPAITMNFELGGALAPDGRCKPFSEDADGIVRAEGCGVVVLKRLRDARRDGDRVLAVVRGTGVNSDGRSNGMMAPNPLAQEALLRDVYARAGVDPAAVDYVEAHGTGTLLGDPIEAGALAAVLGAGRDAARPLLLGSIKSNLGHLEGAAGIAGLIKLVLALQHDRLPASINFAGPNPHIPFTESRLQVVDEPRPWPRYGGVARAGVSAFGFGGTNAHVIIEEAGEPVAPSAGEADGAVVTLPLSAGTEERLRDDAAALARLLDEADGPALGDVAHTLARRRETHTTRLAVTARGRDAAITALDAFARTGEPDIPGVAGPVVVGRRAVASRGDVWVFSGFGSQWHGMGQRLLDEEPAFAAAIDELEPLVQAEAGFSLRSALREPSADETVDQTQVKVFSMQVALAALWRSYGREPGAVIGHSMGEVAAAVATGALTPAEGVRVISLRSRLLQSINSLGGGAMAVLEITADELAELHDTFPDVQVAVFAAPRQQTVAGDAEQVRRLAEHVEGLGRGAWILKVTGAGHSAAVDPILGDLVAGLAGLRPQPPSVPVYTSVHEDPRQTPAFDAEYWRANARQAVRFRHAVAAAADDGWTSFLEVSPHPVAAAAVRQTAADRGATGVVVTPTLRRKADDVVTFRTHAALLAAREEAFDLGALVPRGRQVDLPMPVWRHERFWIDHRPAAAPAGHPLLGAHVELPEGGRHLWRADVGVEALPWMADHAVHGVPVLPGAAYAEMALSAAAEVLGGDPGSLVLRGLELDQVLPLGAHTDVTTSVTVTDAGDARIDVHARPEGAAPGTPMTRHATATVSRLALPDDGWPALPADEGDPVDLYAAFSDAGHRYGPAFTGVGDARLHAGGIASAHVQLPEAATADPRFRVHPALLDVCLQTLGVAAQAYLDGREMELYLPLGIGALRVAADPGRGGRCVATLQPLDEEANGLSGTLQLIAEDGTVLLQADDVYLRRLSRDAIPAPLADKLFEAAWTEVPAGDPADDEPARWLLLAENASEHAVPVEQLARELRAAGDRIELGAHGSEHEVADAVAALAGDTERPPAGIVLVAPTPSSDDVGSDAARELAERLVVAVARTARVAAEAELTHPVRLWVLTRGGASVAAGEGGHPALAALRAAIRVLAFEHPLLRATLVDLDPSGDPLADAVAELRADGADDEVAWRGGARHVRRLQRVALDAPAADAAPPVRDGAYIVTGGLGGLGLVVAGWLADAGATRVVLSGRSAPSPDAETAIAGLRAAGTDVVVVQGDVTRAPDVDAMVSAATADGLPLRGVIHAAGVLQDEVVARVTAAAVERVWAPKVLGAWNLHRATADHDLDLWLMFSSAAGLLGSPGQLAYATANAWLDALVAWRRATGLPATTINWGAWSEVGGVAEHQNALLESLSPAEGVEALGAVLRDGRAQTGVVRLDARRAVELLPGLAKLAFFGDLLAREAPAAADDGGDWIGVAGLRAADPAEARRLLGARLLERVATIMAYRPEQIDVHAPLTSLGADSLIAVRAKNAVEHDFEVTLPVRLLLQDASLADIEAHIAGELGLAEPDGATVAAAAAPGRSVRYVEPRDTTERWLAGVWEEVLGRRPIGATEPLCPPADEAVAERVLARVRDRLGADVDAAALFADGATVETQADLLRGAIEDTGGSPVRTLRAAQAPDTPPLFLFHPAGGTTAVYQPLADLLPDDVSVIGFERIDHLDTIEEKAAHYLQTVRQMQPTGPYRLGGWSLGGCLAYDAARQLRAAGEDVEVVVMIDTILPDHSLVDDEQEAIRGRFERFVEYLETTYEVALDLDVDALMQLPEDEQITAFMDAVASSELGMSAGVLEHQRTSYVDARIAERYHPQPYDGRVVLYRATDRGLTTTLDPRYARQEESLGWDLLCSRLEVVRVTGDHTQIIDRPNVDIIAEHLGVVFADRELAEVAELSDHRHEGANRFRREPHARPDITTQRRDIAL